MRTLTPLLVSLMVALVATPALRWLSHRHNLLDQPNERSSHVNPTPRGGGLAVIAGIGTALALFGRWDDFAFDAILACSAAIALMGILDDILSLGATLKLVVQIGAGTAAIAAGKVYLQIIEIPVLGDFRIPFWLGAFLSLFWIVGMTNAYNFMDGVNGIASVEAIVCASAYVLMFRSVGDSGAVVLCVALVGGAVGFLVFNASGSIFMGDVGSATMGFGFAVLALRLASLGVPFVAAVLPLLPFLVDTSVTLSRRACMHERLFSAHRTHAYQRLTDLGWSHIAVSAAYGIVASVCAVPGILWEYLSPTLVTVALTLLAVFMLVIANVIERKVRVLQA